MKLWKKCIVVVCLLALVIPVFGCSEEGPMEKAGKKLGKATQDASDIAHDTADKAKKLFD
ncbi:hypothetical protein [Pseudodesulfovibrio sp.]|uniref:hypothetical protein n=1 Tax=unclassified Pseudodesulfovibrio TaxID=2661612 RepID=UPI003AFFFD95